MKSHLNHIQININPKNMVFYKELMKFLGWSVIFEDEEFAGYGSGQEGSVWFVKSPKSDQSDSDMVGISHVGLSVSEMKDIDEAVTFLKSKEIECLFDTPKHRPEFAGSKDETYYQVLFRSPDNVLFEIMYTGKK